ncbi:hypothetical protein BT67DRAFT_269248 [Trichocladium antarcticum]|uniref:Uncharacterized protein n=1 Tax=Trichocladium antarcticum TaxID=1450529 RepID=A0AAN6UM72_9PEZI|nr:hypothetical protein BT67DRAFT_269248 [Trichocladium antarcticum]
MGGFAPPPPEEQLLLDSGGKSNSAVYLRFPCSVSFSGCPRTAARPCRVPALEHLGRSAGVRSRSSPVVRHAPPMTVRQRPPMARARDQAFPECSHDGSALVAADDRRVQMADMVLVNIYQPSISAAISYQPCLASACLPAARPICFLDNNSAFLSCICMECRAHTPLRGRHSPERSGGALCAAVSSPSCRVFPQLPRPRPSSSLCGTSTACPCAASPLADFPTWLTCIETGGGSDSFTREAGKLRW